MQPPVKLGNSRVTGKEQYYTPASVATTILSRVVDIIDSPKNFTFLEPAGGTGAFINAATEYGFRSIVSFDIEPLHQLVRRGSFLDQDLDDLPYVTVSNPPFGRNNALSIPFFNKAAEHSALIAFIVPRSWRKWSVQNKLDQHFELMGDDDLDIDYVDADGSLITANNNLRTCVQYWKRSESLRPRTYIKDMGVIERCKFPEADASLTLFGYGCGTVRTDFPRKANTTQMFLKLKHPQALEALRAVNFSRFSMNTAYTEALSIQEINFLLNEYIFGDPMIVHEKHLSRPPKGR